MQLVFRVALLFAISALAACASQPAGTPADTNVSAAADYPRFPLPAPKPSAKLELSFASLGPGLSTAGAVNRRLIRDLDARGYSERSYFAVPGGFALVTRAERFERDGRSSPPDRRWVLEPMALFRLGDFSVSHILAALRNADPGRYRVIVFLVTTKPRTSGEGSVSIEQANDWLAAGADVLPSQIAEIGLGPEHHLSTLIYEFARSSVRADAHFVERSRLAARQHLIAAGLIGG